MSLINHENSEKDTGLWEFRLYINGETPRSRKAIDQVKQLCKKYLAEKYHLECIDILKSPERGSMDQILATPTLLKLNPPIKRILGDFSDECRLLQVIGLEDVS